MHDVRDKMRQESLLVSFIVLIGVLHATFGQSIQPSLQIPCRYDDDCMRNAFCDRSQNGGLCSCKDTYIQQKNRTSMDCLPTPLKMGDDCEQNIQCQISFGSHAMCKDSLCQCMPNTHFEDGICYKNGKIGDRCSTSSDCYIEGAQTYCDLGFCTCHGLFHAVENGTRCVQSAKLGDKCSTDEECTVNFTRCLGVCRCQINFVANNNQSGCLKAANAFGDSCEEDPQCSEFLTMGACVDKKCGCSTGFHNFNLKCWRSASLLGDCINDNECKIKEEWNDAVTCSAGKCVCIYGMAGQNDDCVTPRKSFSHHHTTSTSFIISIALLSICVSNLKLFLYIL